MLCLPAKNINITLKKKRFMQTPKPVLPRTPVTITPVDSTPPKAKTALPSSPVAAKDTLIIDRDAISTIISNKDVTIATKLRILKALLDEATLDSIISTLLIPGLPEDTKIILMLGAVEAIKYKEKALSEEDIKKANSEEMTDEEISELYQKLKDAAKDDFKKMGKRVEKALKKAKKETKKFASSANRKAKKWLKRHL